MKERFTYLDKFRMKTGPWGTSMGEPYGLFFIPFKYGATPLKVLASPFDKGEWQHVSVSLPGRCPTWDEMNFIKGLFWDDEELVIQFHPPKSEYINNHPFCLHLWRNTEKEIPMPPSILVGIK